MSALLRPVSMSTRRRLAEPMLVVLSVVVAATVGAVAGAVPVLTLLVSGMALVAVRVLARPDLATLGVVAVIYSNAAVIAVRIHGAPETIQYVVPLVLAVPLAHRLLRRGDAPVAARVLPLAAVFLAVQILSGLLSRDPALAMESVRISALEGVSLLVLLPNAIDSVATMRRCVWALVLIGATLGGLSLVQTVAGVHDQQFLGFAQPGEEPPPATDDVFAPDPVRRLGGPIGEKNRYAQVLLLSAPLALVVARRERTARLRILAGASLVMILAGVILTFSRGAALAVVVLAIAAVVLRELPLKRLAAAALAAAVLMVAVPQYRDRLTSITALATATDRSVNRDETDGSIRSRVTENLAAIAVFADHPVLGVGPDQFPSYYSDYASRIGIRIKNADREAHNLYLDIAADLGLAGLLSFLALAATMLRMLSRARRRARDPMLQGLAGALLLSLLAYLVTGLFLHFSFVRYFWLFVALGATVVLLVDHEDEAGRGASAPAGPSSAPRPAP